MIGTEPASTNPETPSPWTPAELPTDGPSAARPVRGLRERVTRIFELLGLERPNRWLCILALSVLVDIVVFSWAQILAYGAYYTFSQDFGSFNQSFYTAAFDHKLFYYTSNIPAGTNGTFFAVHFSPFLFVLLPFYALAPAPTTLLVFKVTALGLAAFPVYGIAQHRLGSAKWGVGFGLAYLLSPLTMTLDWLSFDMEVFLPFFVLSAFYFLTVKRRVGFFVFWALALASIETVAPLLGLSAFLALVGAYWGPRRAPTADRRSERLLWFGACALTIGWYLLAFEAVRAFNPAGGTFGVGYQSHYTVLGASSFFDVIPRALLNPSAAGAALAHAGSTKLLYSLILVGCLAFFPLFGELRYSLPVAFWLALALLSNFPPMYSLGSQYLGYVSPFLFAGAIGGVVYLRSLFAREFGQPAPVAPEPPRRWTLPGREESILPASLGLAVLLCLVVANPLTTAPVAGLSSIQYGIPSPTPHTQLLDRAIQLIPSQAGVLTTAHLFPQVSDRPSAYVLPTTQLFAGNSSYWGSLDAFINESSFVLLDFTIDQYPAQLILYFGNFTGFGTVVCSDGVYLLERGWTQAPLPGFWSGSSAIFHGSRLATRFSTAVNENESLYYVNGGTSGVNFWRGPSVSFVTPGTYTLNVSFRVHSSSLLPLFSFRPLWTPIVIDPVQYLNSSAGHHYAYVFVRQSPEVVASANVSIMSGSQGSWVTENSSLTVTVTGFGTLSSVGVSLGPSFAIYVGALSLSLAGPPPYFGDQARP
ncbi:MAG: DUF2079 domain-containing protein [Thermoplasmata archaeon]|nr:DUF2079 domain-containing protein [Thermoplasmata archaeon]